MWLISWIIFCPVAAASFTPSKYPGQLILGAASGATFILTLVVIRLSLGWYYIRSRLLNPRIFYEESGWYDGGDLAENPGIFSPRSVNSLPSSATDSNSITTNLLWNSRIVAWRRINLGLVVNIHRFS